MDHIELPRDRKALEIEFPLLAKEGYQYDGLGLDTFPARRGYVDTSGKLISHDSPALWTSDDIEFVQAWLYFGLLREVLGSLFRQDDFLVHKHGRICLTTAKLKGLLKQKQAQGLSLPQRWKVVGALWWLGTWQMCKSTLDKLNNDIIQERRRISLAVDWTLQQCERFDRKFEDRRCSAVLLSVRLLAEAIHSVLCMPQNIQQPFLKLGLRPRYCSLMLIKEHMLRKDSGWCSHHFNIMIQRLSCTTLVYLANLRRHIPAWISHEACLQQNQCVAYNSNNDFQAVHVEQGCSCAHVLAPVQDMQKILESGGIPVLKSSRASTKKRDPQRFSLSFVSAAPGAFYAAISHLWADGLGNQRANSIPLCQVRRLHELVGKSNYSVAKSAPLLDRPKKNRSFLLKWPIQALRHLWKEKYQPSDNQKVVYYWLDVYCVPVVEEHLASLEKARLQRLKDTALSRMTATYSWANYVLVLDHELSMLTAKSNYKEFLGRATISGWNSRFWTYQEYCMARTVVFGGQGTPIGTHTVGIDGSLGWPLFGLAPSRTQSHTLSEFTDLSNVLYRPHFATGMRIGETLSYGQEGRLKNFVHLWNLLQDKNTTKPGDELLIFGMLMDLSSGELKNVAATLGNNGAGEAEVTTETRMKAILKTFRFLPLEILFLESLRPVCRCHSLCKCQGNRWMPRRLRGAGYLNNPEDRLMELTELGLRIPSQTLFNPEGPRLTAVQLIDLHGSECTFVLGPKKCTARFVDRRDCSITQRRQTPVILLLDMSHGRQSGKGACFIIIEVFGGVTRTVYAGPVSWNTDSHTDISTQQKRHMCEAHVLTAADIGDLFVNCDTRDWPRLRLRRDLLHQQRRKLKKTFRLVEIGSRIFLCLLFVLLFATAFGNDQDQNSLLWFFWGFIFLIATGFWSLAVLRSMYNRTIDYISMEQLSPDADPEDRWWESLEKVLPGMRQGVVPTALYFQWQMKVTLNVAVQLGKLFSRNDRARRRSNLV